VSQRRNYRFERRRRADALRAKQEVKRDRKASRAAAGAEGPEMGEVQDSGVQPGTWEWFSPSRSQTRVTSIGDRPETDHPPNDWVLLTDVPPDPEASAPDDGASDPP
jgi:hypothetical protein